MANNLHSELTLKGLMFRPFDQTKQIAHDEYVFIYSDGRYMKYNPSMHKFLQSEYKTKVLKIILRCLLLEGRHHAPFRSIYDILAKAHINSSELESGQSILKKSQVEQINTQLFAYAIEKGVRIQ